MIENTVLVGNVLDQLKGIPDEAVQTCVTSPPYWGLRDYDHPDQVGLEETPEEYVEKLVEIFREVRRTLTPDGTLWLNIGDSYTPDHAQARNTPDKNWGKHNPIRGSRVRDSRGPTGDRKPKDLTGIPWMCALALRGDGWYLRSEIIWDKPNVMPEAVFDRPSKAHEHIFLLSKSPQYWYDADAVKERGVTTETRNCRTVWSIPTKPYPGAHFAVFPEELPRRCLRATSKPGDIVLDPFAGSGTTLAVAVELGRKYVGIELNPKYQPLIEERLRLAYEYRDGIEMFELAEGLI